MLLLASVLLSGTLVAGVHHTSIPVTFEPAQRTSEFIGHVEGRAVTLSASGATAGIARMRLVGANAAVRPEGEGLLAGYTNYLTAPNPAKWRTHVPNYARVRFLDVYPRIDVIYYARGNELEFDFVVAPGGDPRQIRLDVSPEWNLHEPRVLQGDRVIVSRAVRKGARVTFELGRYDHSQALVIDPVLSFAAFAGSGYQDVGKGVAVDSAGNAYVLGTTYTGAQIYVSKVNAGGTDLIYSTYLPGAPGYGFNNAAAIAVDGQGSAYFAANVLAGTFAIPAPQRCNSFNVGTVAAKLSPDGASLAFATFLCSGSGGASTSGAALALDPSGNIYVATDAAGPGVTPLVNSLQPQPGGLGTSNPLIAKLDPRGAVIYSTFLGGSGFDIVNAIAADAAGNAYVTGSAISANFPVKAALQPQLNGTQNAFVSKINADGSALVYSTYLGGSNSDIGRAIAADSAGNAYIAGTAFSGDFPTASAFQPRLAGAIAFKSTDGGSTWNSSDSGLGGTASAIVPDPQNPGTIYILTGGRVFKSGDRAATWKPVGPAGLVCLAIGPDSTLYAGQGRNVLRSADGGQTWPVVYSSNGALAMHVAAHPQNAAIVYAGFQQGGGDGLYKSTDGGTTWKATAFAGGGFGVQALALDPQDTSTLYACSNARGCNRSNDGGATWSQSHMAGSAASFSGFSLVVDPVTSSQVYALAFQQPGNETAVFESTDQGDNFVPQTALPGANVLAADPAHPGALYAGTSTGVYKSTDGSATWQAANTGMGSSNVVSLTVDTQSAAIYAGVSAQSDGFVTKLSPDGSTLVYSTYFGGSGTDSLQAITTDAAGNAYLAGPSLSADLPLKDSFRAGVPNDGFAAKLDPGGALVWSSKLGGGIPSGIALGGGAVYVTGTSTSAGLVTSGALQGLNGNFFTSANAGVSWSSSPAPPTSTGPYVVVTDPKAPSRVLIVNAGRVFQSADGGGSWAQINAPVFVKLLAIDPVSPATMYIAGAAFIGDGVVFKSTDGGATWNAASNGLPTTGDRNPNVLLIDPKTPSTLYLATDTGIYKTTDGSGTWQRVGQLAAVIAMAMDPQNPATLYASAPNIFKSTDGGATWTDVYQNFVYTLAVDPSNPQRVYGTAGSNLFFRSDAGGQTGTWVALNPLGLPVGQFGKSSLAVDATGQLYLGCSVAGLFKSTDLGAHWTALPVHQLVNAIAIDPFNLAHIYVATQANSQNAFVMRIVE